MGAQMGENVCVHRTVKTHADGTFFRHFAKWSFPVLFTWGTEYLLFTITFIYICLLQMTQVSAAGQTQDSRTKEMDEDNKNET